MTPRRSRAPAPDRATPPPAAPSSAAMGSAVVAEDRGSSLPMSQSCFERKARSSSASAARRKARSCGVSRQRSPARLSADCARSAATKAPPQVQNPISSQCGMDMTPLVSPRGESRGTRARDIEGSIARPRITPQSSMLDDSIHVVMVAFGICDGVLAHFRGGGSRKPARASRAPPLRGVVQAKASREDAASAPSLALPKRPPLPLPAPPHTT